MSVVGPCFYFGCVERPGHFLFDERLVTVYDRQGSVARSLNHFDGALCYPEKDGPYIAALSRLWGLGYSALSFWDYTVDKRGACNSNFFIPDLNGTPAELLAIAGARFPRIFARLPAISVNRAVRDILGPEFNG